MLKKQDKNEVTRVGRKSDFTWMVPGMGLVYLPKGIHWVSKQHMWRLFLGKKAIAARSVGNRSHQAALAELIEAWRETFNSTIANPERGYKLAHEEFGRVPRGSTGVGGVYEMPSRTGKILGYTVTCPHENKNVFIAVSDFYRREYAFVYAKALRERSLLRHQIALKYRGIRNANR